MTTAPGADELRLRYLLRTRGVAFVPQPPTTRPDPEDPPMQIAYFANVAVAATVACLLLRRSTARDTAVLAGALLGICASAVVWSPLVGWWLGV